MTQVSPPTLVLAKTPCTGSLTPIDAQVVEGKLFYTASVQGIQFAELSRLDLAAGLSPFDFPESMMLANTDIAEFENGQLKRVWLFPHGGKSQETQLTPRLRAQRKNCFDQSHHAYIDAKRTKLSPSAIRLFMVEVMNCMKAVR